MKKLKLDLDSLVVETFATDITGGAGTVEGHTGNIYASGCCDYASDTGCDPEGQTCNNSCVNGTCDPVLNTCGGCATGVHTPLACANISFPNCTGQCTNIIQCTNLTCGGSGCDQ